MLLNKKCMYLGVTLFSAMILTSLPINSVKADTTAGTTSAVVTNAEAATGSNSNSTATSTQPVNTVQSQSVTTPAKSTSMPADTDSQTVTAPASTAKVTSVTTPVATGKSTSTVQTPINTVQPTVATSTSKASSVSTTRQTTVSKTGSDSSAVVSPVAPTPTKPTTSINNNTVVSFDDSLLENMMKSELGLNSKQNITVGDLKGFNNPEFDADEALYLLNMPNANPNLTDAQVTPIESLNGMQYLQYLPKNTQVYMGIKLASGPKANEDLTPLDKINFAKITLYGNYSDPNAKEIDVSQLPNINVSNLQYLNLSGDPSVSDSDGLTNQQLTTIAPWLVKYSNNGQSYSDIELDNSQLTDLSSLSGINKKSGMGVFVANSNSQDATPIKATVGKSITFTAAPIIGINGQPIFNNYHYTTTVAKNKVADDDLENLGKGQYEIAHPDTNAEALTYGNIGWYLSSKADDMISETYGTDNVQYYGLKSQPIDWVTPTATTPHKAAVVTPNKTESTTPAKTVKTTANVVIAPVQTPKVTPKVVANAITATELQKGVVRTNDLAHLVNADGTTISATLSPNSEWSYDKIVTIKGMQYYRVATNEYLPVNNVMKFTPVVATIKVNTGKAVKLYRSDGEQLRATLPANSNWATDGCTVINGMKMYRVATDEWIPATAIQNPYQKVSTVYKATTTTPIYDANGKMMTRELSSGTSWKVDQKVWINGVEYYRVATNEFVKA